MWTAFSLKYFILGPHGESAESLSPLSMSSRTLAATSRQERSDAARISPFLTHIVARHNSQLTLIPPQGAERTRKGGKSQNLGRSRTERRCNGEEPRFNTAAPQSLRSLYRRGNTTSERNSRPALAAPSRFFKGKLWFIIIFLHCAKILS